MATLDTTNARAFNASLKKAVKDLTGDKTIKVEIINSYKFPKCWVRIYSVFGFTNDFRLKIYDACYSKRDDLLDVNNVSYGNIQSRNIAILVPEWEKLFN